MLEAGAGPRPHWRTFADGLARLSPEELGRRWELGQRLLRDNGVTYNVYGDPAGLDRPWQLDPLPLILSEQEWLGIREAVTQRATLLDFILSDLYGRRSLVSAGLIPSAALHANPNFLRPCHGWVPAGKRWLHYYAADLARGADGRWRVIGDRTEAPAGAGYALENRSIVSRVLPEFHRSLHVGRLGGFFEDLRRGLQNLSPRHIDEPRIVLLTPGPYNAIYFEPAYLARPLGVTLVQGEDLTVRDNNVYLKALTGLQQVDVILRRTDSSWCDPLELRGESTLGVAGLVQSARAGHVAIVNGLGTGLLDGGALMPYLPAIAKARMSEELLMPSVPSWWCGDPAAQAHVLANLDHLQLRPAFAGAGQPVLGAAMGEAERDEWRRAIAARPWEWVAQEVGAGWTVPVWRDGRLEPQHAVLRVFAAATEHGWQVMPGGLARVSAEPDFLNSRLQAGGGGSKDVWIVSEDRRDAPAATRAPTRPVRLTRDNRDLPSRVADNMYWLGRYLERCDTTTRLLRATLREIESALDQGDAALARQMLHTMAVLNLRLPADAFTVDPDHLLERLADYQFGGAPGTLSDHVGHLSRTVGRLRDRLSLDTWRALQRLRDEIGGQRTWNGGGAGIARLNSVVLTLEAVSGLAMENMTRGPQWLFLDSGRRLERAIVIVETLSGALTDAEGEDAVPMDLLLEIWDSIMTYRSRYLASPRLAGVLDLLLCDESNPRSLGFQLGVLSRHMDGLAQAGGSTGFFRPEQKLMTVLYGTIRTTDVLELSRFDPDGGFHDAERLLDFLRNRLWQLSEEISRTYFSHAQWRLPVAPMDILP